MKNLSLILVLLLSISLFQSCVKEDVQNPDTVAPELPQADAFIMSFEGFQSSDTAAVARNSTDGNINNATYHNWFYGATNVLIWNTVLGLNLAIPVTSYLEAFNHQAEFQGDATWLWAYDWNDDNGAIYQAKLYGKVLGAGEVKWDMYISKNGGFQEVNWYSGVTSNNGATANWTLHHKPHNPETFIQIDFQRNSTGAEVIRYTNIIPNASNNGDFIEFRKTDNQTGSFNRAYDIYKIEQNNLLEINWNVPSNNGRVKDAIKYGDENWHCWDIELRDVDC